MGPNGCDPERKGKPEWMRSLVDAVKAWDGDFECWSQEKNGNW